LLGAFLAASLIAYGTNRIVHERIDLIFSGVSDFFSGQARTNIGERFLMWQASYKMFLSNPLFGVGTGDFVTTLHGYISSGEFPDYLLRYNQPHSIYFFALATNGLLGIGALLYLFYRALFFAYRCLHAAGQERLFGLLAVAVLVHYLVGGFTDSFFNIQMLRYTFAFIMGLCIRSSFSQPLSR
jgi:O-antigen ligase